MTMSGASHIREPERKTLELSRFLTEVPASRTVLEYLVIEHWSQWQARAAWISIPEETGFFRLEASFGTFDAQQFETSPPPIWGDHPLATALRLGAGLVTSVADDANLTPYFAATDVASLAIQPLRPNSHERYVIAVGCSGEASNADGCLNDLLVDAPLLSLYLSYLSTRRLMAAEGMSSLNSAETTQSLTARQSTILRLMADGMKNREIAFSIGFSESTVRLETIDIYKKLGVHGRHEAIRVAVRLGLLEDPIS